MKPSAALLSVLALSCAGALAACGSGSTGAGSDAGNPGDAGTASDAGTADAGTSDAGAADAGTDAGTAGDAGADAGDSDPPGCTATTSYGTVTPANQSASYSPSDTDGGLDDEYQYFGDLNADTKVDYLDIELYGTDGVFANGVATGTYTLAGDELNYQTCGLCLLVFTDTDPTTQMPVDAYMATGGTVTLTSLYPTLAGTVANATFQHVTIDQSSYLSTPVNDGCVSAITQLSFSAGDSGSSRQVHRVRRANAAR